jgi:hypothetical protein
MQRPHVIKAGPCRVSIFRNMVRIDGTDVEFPKLKLEVIFRRHGRWGRTSSISLRELPAAILALQKAHEYLLSKKPKSAPPKKEPFWSTLGGSIDQKSTYLGAQNINTPHALYRHEQQTIIREKKAEIPDRLDNLPGKPEVI